MIDLLEGITTNKCADWNLQRQVNWNDWPAWRDYDKIIRQLFQADESDWNDWPAWRDYDRSKASCRSRGDLQVLKWLTCLKGLRRGVEFTLTQEVRPPIEMIDLLEGITTLRLTPFSKHTQEIEMIDLLEGITTRKTLSRTFYTRLHWNDWPAWRDYDHAGYIRSRYGLLIEMIDLLEGITTIPSAVIFNLFDIIEMIDLLEGITTFVPSTTSTSEGTNWNDWPAWRDYDQRSPTQGWYPAYLNWNDWPAWRDYDSKNSFHINGGHA